MPEFIPRRVGETYYAEWWEDGVRRRSSLRTKSRDEAKVLIKTFASAYRDALNGTPTTIEAIYAGYAADRRSAGKSASERIEYAWKQLAPHFGNGAGVDVITDEGVRAYNAARRKRGASDGTIHVELGYLRAAIRFAKVKRKWIDVEPYIELPKKPPPRDHYLTKDQAKAALAACETPHVALFITLALSTAGRAGAILDLTWDRIDFARRKIVLAAPDRAVTPKGRATVPMNLMAEKALLQAKSVALSDHVIEWAGERIESVKKAVGRAGARVGLKLSPHVLRHSAAVWMAEDGVPMEEIASYLGHNNVMTTRRVYARYSPDHLRRAASALEL